MSSTTNQIERQIEIQAPVARVWRALTDYKEFGAWFRVNLEGPFVPGQKVRGNITSPGYEHLTMELVVETITPQSHFSFHWHPYAIDPKIDYSHETPTLVLFKLKAIPTGTLLTVTESGFDALPPERRDEAFRMNDGGWAAQMENILNYVNANS